MHEQACPDLTAIYRRDSRDPSTLVADGYGLHVHVERGHLVITDGIGSTRRERRIPKIERTVSRLVILGHTGNITLQAIRWCTDVGIAIIHIDLDGRLLLAAGAAGRDDARLRRAQALAPSQPVGLEITRALLAEKLDGQATVLQRLGEPILAERVQALRGKLIAAESASECQEIEAQAASSYFAAWARHVRPTFAAREQPKVPQHWLTHDGRGSVLDYGRSPRKAANPVNALLNYAYTLAEAECRLALIAVGLDPGLGILHSDRKNRDSLALDLIEPLRPAVDRMILDLLARKRLRALDFHETNEGNCRLLAPLTHELAEGIRPLRLHTARLAQQVANAIAGNSPLPITRASSRLTRRGGTDSAQSIGRRPRKQAPAATATPRTCRDCGTDLPDTARVLCGSCWPITRAKHARERAARGVEARSTQLAAGVDPTNTPQARSKRAVSLSTRKREQLAWEARGDEVPDIDYQHNVLPGLATIPLRQIQTATGLTIGAASRIRSGGLTPHRRHWQALYGLVHRQQLANTSQP